jgi:hypothetical protein
VHADLFDEQAEEFFGLLTVAVGNDLVEFVGEAGEGGTVERRVRVCGDACREVGFLPAKRIEALTVAAYALVAERG